MENHLISYPAAACNCFLWDAVLSRRWLQHNQTPFPQGISYHPPTNSNTENNYFYYFCHSNALPMRFAYAYIMTNKGHTTLYTGCTNDLVRRVAEHKSHHYKGSFTDKYNCEYCVYYKEFTSYQAAIDEENRIKGLSRKDKIELIETKNPEWKELVTEKGFVHDKTPWSEKVKQVMDDLMNNQ